MPLRSCILSTVLLLACTVHGATVYAQQAGSGSQSRLDTQNENASTNINARLRRLIRDAGGHDRRGAFKLPGDGNYRKIPQDPKNPITRAKVKLGKQLFHDTAFALNGVSGELMSGTWSCATCHHSAAGFKSGSRQGIAEGGIGFGSHGQDRQLAAGFDALAAAGASNLPDLQPLASPSVLHSAWQDVMLWNGQFGNSDNGIVNAGIDAAILATPGTPKEANLKGFSGVEIQAIAGSGVHRLKFDEDTPLQTNRRYRKLWERAYGNQDIDATEGAALAIAAYERTLVANRAPFQKWLKGDVNAMSLKEKQGAILFFGDAGCAACHTGPGLSSATGASADQMFFAVGFGDLDHQQQGFEGQVDSATRLGRGGFTGIDADNYKFKIPQLYNLADSPHYGHGASFDSIRAVVEYKNTGIAQNPASNAYLDARFVPLGLSGDDVDALTAFLAHALFDPQLSRYEPESVPGDGCVIVDALDSIFDERCMP